MSGRSGIDASEASVRDMRTGLLVGVLAAFYLVGVGMTGYALWATRRALQASNWPTTAGKLEVVKLDEVVGTGTGPRNVMPMYRVHVEYSYAVSGRRYHGSRLAFGYSASNDRSFQHALFEKLKGAESVDVRYDPAAPESCTLSAGMSRSLWLAVAFSVFWLLFTLGFTALWLLAARQDAATLQNLSVH